MDHIHSPLKITIAQISDKGPKPENQDTIGARIPDGSALTTKGIAIVIADGVSSSKAARQASQSAVAGFLTDYYATPDTWRTHQSAAQVIKSLNRYLWGQSQNSIRDEGYLTTFSSLILKGDSCFIFHVGDTRIYRFRDNSLEQLTRDHTQKIDQNTTYLSRALGADSVLEIDAITESLRVGDMYMLSSDGIHDAIPHNELKALLDTETDPQTIAEQAIALAEKHNTQDNLSIQIIRIDHLGSASQHDAVTLLSKLPFPPPLNLGQTIDGYKIKKIMHESERSQVYLVCGKNNKQLVMKTPSPNYDDDPAYIERFVMEAWIGTRINNPNVVRIVQPQQERKFLYYLTEYVPGPTLAQLIKERAPIAIPDAIEFIETLLKGIRGFHRKDTLHQDLKPDNIIVGANGPIIIDFGACFVAGLDEVPAPFTRDTILGTLSYSAPEYRYGGRISQRSDQFSIAIMLYEMLTGKRPYGEKYDTAMNLKAFQRLSYTPARKHNPLVPIWLDKAIERGCDIQEQARYSALSEWLTDLKRPNPNWLRPEETPLMERNPLLFWKLAACTGWAGVLFFITQKLSSQ